MRFIVFVLGMTIATLTSSAGENSMSVQDELQILQSQRMDVPGFAIAVIDKNGTELAATGQADPSGTPMSAETPVRIASITKTFVAAAVLRLSEEQKLDLDASISELLAPELNALLANDGYNTNRITVRHLLMHVGGLSDHVGDEYVEQIFTSPEKVWAPQEQLELLVSTTDPVAEPGVAFSYSDSGYIVLGEILRGVTGLPLHQAVRELIKLDQFDTPTIYWDEVEQPGHDVRDRAHQWFEGTDIYYLHGSMDGHGGGGLVASVEDIAELYHALFTNKIFTNPSTLELMKTAPGHPEDSPYRLGLFTSAVGDIETFHHSGFWGTYAVHVPSLNLTVAAVALDNKGYRDLRQFIDQIIERKAE
ncbi:MAG: beta-lactamase family protein [Aquisalinus sp.]|nr:beta-lactamase family protein [Aquisalinus sp.]